LAASERPNGGKSGEVDRRVPHDARTLAEKHAEVEAYSDARRTCSDEVERVGASVEVKRLLADPLI
jgi:hypothetical protein